MSQEYKIEIQNWTGSETDAGAWGLDSNAATSDRCFRLNAHRCEWLSAISNGLRHRAYIIRCSRNDVQLGLLPLVVVSGPLFGRFLISLPYVNTGGVWAHNTDVAVRLIDAACELSDRLNVRYLELRHELPVAHPSFNFERTEKVHMRLPLPESAEALLASFKSKLRSQIKKSGEYGLTVEFGGGELMSDFYDVFARNMRDLGTPVFSRSLFDQILKQFAGDAELCIVRQNRRAIAAGLLVHYGHLTEVPSASCLREFNRTGANMLMYWHLLQRAIERGSQTFDFGRSSRNSGTYKFKAQWGAVPHPAVWQYYVRQGSPDEMRPDSGGKQRLVKVWQRLPVWLTRIIGPSIVRGIP